jgi:hypothetical protein
MARTQSEKRLASDLAFDPKKVAALYNEHGYRFLRRGKDAEEPITGTDIVGGYAGTARLQAQTFDLGGGHTEIRYTLDLGTEYLGPDEAQLPLDFASVGFYL